MSRICYKRNFIKKVLAKVDFAQPLLDLNEDSLLNAISEIKKRFPISEQTTGIKQGVQISIKEIKESKSNFPQWVFHSEERDKEFVLNPFFMHVLLKKYNSEDDFKSDLINPITQIITDRADTLIARTGIRFINVFDLDLFTFSNINQYFSEYISLPITSIIYSENCTRSFLTNEFNFNEIKVRIQSGFFNPDYPAIIKRKHFVIDVDAYIDLPHKISNISNYFSEFHKIIQDIFEKSITPKLRDEVLNGT